MKTIKVFIASSEELHLERLEFTDMIMQLNKALKPRGIEIEPVKWEYLDASMNAERKQTEYNIALKECELCLVMYWTKFGEYTEEELTTAWEGLKAGENPRKLYVYFKEPGDASQELKDFKESFVTRYGHFYCKFENVDTLRLNFLLQFEQYQSSVLGGIPIVEINNSKVELDGTEYINLKNIPFVGNNEEYNDLLKNIKKTQKLLSITDETDPEYEEYEEELKNLKDKQIKKERGLWDTALRITMLSTKRCSERLQRAIDLFNSGDDRGAIAILNEDEIDHDVEYNLNLIRLGEEGKKGLAVNIEEYNLKISILRSHTNIEEASQVLILCQKVLPLCIELYGELGSETIEAHYNLAQAYADNGSYNESELEYIAALNICNEESTLYAEILRSLGRLHILNEMPLKGKPFIEQALELTAKKYGENNLIYIKSLRDISLLYKDMDLYDDAIAASTKALSLLELFPNYDKVLYNSIKRTLAIVYEIRERLINIGNNECTSQKDKDDLYNAIQLLKEIYESEISCKQSTVYNLYLIGNVLKRNSKWPNKDNPQLLEAAEYLSKGLTIAKEINDKTHEKKILECLADVYKSLGTPEKAESLGYSYPKPQHSDGKTISEAVIEYRQEISLQYQEIANKIATVYLEKFPRRKLYGVHLTSIGYASEMTVYTSLSEEEIKIIKECSLIANEESCSLDEILDSEGYNDLLEKLFEHDTCLPLNSVESVDLDNPLKFTSFSYQELNDNGELEYMRSIGCELTDDEFKEILVELLLSSNRYSMNMLVYRKPDLCQKITRHITYASMDYQFENRSSYIADMYEHKSICESILNPFKDILDIFNSNDDHIRKFAINHQLVPECGEQNELYANYEDHGNDSFHVLMHYEGTKIIISQEGMTRIKANFHDLDRFTIDAYDVMKKYSLEKPEDIYPYLKQKCNNANCFYMLRKDLINQ